MTVVCSGNTFIDILKKHVEDNNVKLTSYKFLLDLKGLNHQGSCGQRVERKDVLVWLYVVNQERVNLNVLLHFTTGYAPVNQFGLSFEW